MHQLEKQQIFSQSQIWQLQRDYFRQSGIDAWRSGAVPHYITSNPVVGKTYAELVLAFLRDLSLKGQHEETVYLLELGAGHGRLCYHFFKHFEKYYEHSAIPLPPFCYVLTDFTEANLTFWQEHPRLQPYLSLGWLDLALFDAEQSETFHLQYANRTIQRASLAQPLIVIANYFFDTIPQSLFRIENETIDHVLLSLTTATDPSTSIPAEIIAALQLTYDYETAASPIYPADPHFNDMLEAYRQHGVSTHLLFPDSGLRCIERLRQLSQAGVLLLTADKGEHHLPNLDQRSAPKLSKHGSFSLNVNYHAFSDYCTRQGGLPLFPAQQQATLDLGCLLFLPDADSYKETLNAYLRFVNDFGPDDYFSLKKLIEQHFDSLSYRDIMGTLRLSGYDARIFGQMWPRLLELLPDVSASQQHDFFLASARIWDTYYPIGEAMDIADALGDLLLTLDFYAEAIFYFEMSLLIYGSAPETLYKLAVCHCLLGQFIEATPLIADLHAYDPENEVVQELIKEFAIALPFAEKPASVEANDSTP